MEEYPLINKPWFMNPGLTLNRDIMGHGYLHEPSGKLTVRCGNSSCSISKSTINGHVQ